MIVSSNRILLCWVLSLFLCGQSAVGQVQDRVQSRSEPDQTYALFLPKNYEQFKAADESRRWPVLLGFSPSGNGQRVVSTYRAAAEKFGWIILASNNSRNGSWDVIQAATEALWKEAHEQYAIDESRIYTTGMSGGAAVAAMQAKLHEGKIVGVFMHARGEWSTLPPSGSTTFYRLHAGLHDFNLGECLRFLVHARRVGCVAEMDVHAGAHGWAPLERAMGDLRFAEIAYHFQGAQEFSDKPLIQDELADLGEALEGPFALLAMQRLQGLAQIISGEPCAEAVEKLLAQWDQPWWKRESSAWQELQQDCLFDTQIQDRYPGQSSLSKVVKARRKLTDRYPGTTAGLLVLCVDLNATISLGRAKVNDETLKAAYRVYMDGAALNRPKFRKQAIKLLRKKKLVPAMTALFAAHVLKQVDGKQELAKSTFKRIKHLAGRSWFMARQRPRTRR